MGAWSSAGEQGGRWGEISALEWLLCVNSRAKPLSADTVARRLSPGDEGRDVDLTFCGVLWMCIDSVSLCTLPACLPAYVCLCVWFCPCLGVVQPDSLAGVTRRRLAASTNTSLLSECVSMRRAVYKKLASSTVDSRPVRRAVYRWVGGCVNVRLMSD